MAETKLAIELSWLKYIIKPVARLCLNCGIGAKEIFEVVKICLVEVSKEEIAKVDEKLSVSKLSVMTGLQRKDLLRLMKTGGESKNTASLVSRVIGQWEQDSRFCTTAGSPRVLSCEGADSEFAQLVLAVSSDLHYGTILNELKRLGSVADTKGGVKLVRRAPDVRSDPQKGYQVLGADIQDLILTTNENLFARHITPHLHARTEYDNIFKEDLPIIQEWLLKEGSELHQRARNFLSKYDQDINPHIKKESGAKVSLTAYSYSISDE